MGWRKLSDKLPTSLELAGGIDENIPIREEYSRQFGWSYASYLLSKTCSSESVHIPRKTSHEFFLLFTFEGNNSAFLIAKTRGSGTDVDDSRMLTIPSEHEVTMKLSANGKPHEYKLSISSFDKIEFKHFRR